MLYLLNIEETYYFVYIDRFDALAYFIKVSTKSWYKKHIYVRLSHFQIGPFLSIDYESFQWNLLNVFCTLINTENNGQGYEKLKNMF